MRDLLRLLPTLLLLVAAVPEATASRRVSPSVEAPVARHATPAAEVPAELAPLVLVLPFRAEGAGQPEWLSAGAARFLAEAVRVAGFRAVGAADVRAALQDVGLHDEPRLSLASAAVLARQLGARHVVVGRSEATGPRIQLEAEAIDAERLRLLHEARATATADGLGLALGTLAEALTGEAGRRPEARASLESLSVAPARALQAWMTAAAEPEQAELHLRAALAAAPEFVPARLDLVAVLLEEGRVHSARGELHALRGGLDTPRRAASRALAGRLHLALGEHAQAVDALEESVRLGADPATLLWLAEAHLAAGSREAAADAVQRVLRLDPTDSAALELLQRTRDHS